MSFGDEAHESRPGVVVQLRQNRFAEQPRPCTGCDSDHFESGELCEECREGQPQVSAAFVQSTVADAIRKLDKIRQASVAPLALPLQQALSDMRRAFDSLEPLIQTFQIGVIAENESGLFYAVPYGAVESIGPFGKRGHAERALVDYALENTNWESQ